MTRRTRADADFSRFLLCTTLSSFLLSSATLPVDPPNATNTATDPPPQEGASNTHSNSSTATNIYFVLDRSGSMHAIKDDVVGGFNSFVEEQRRADPSAGALRLSLIQFDTIKPHDVVYPLTEIAAVPPIRFDPRGGTPLYDAIGLAVNAAEEASRAGEAVVFVIFSDGAENSSREFSQTMINKLIERKKKDGWTFVFLGANQDSYAAGGGLGVAMRNTQNFAFDGQGTSTAFESLSKSAKMYRAADAETQHTMSEDFFGGEKLAEADYQRRVAKKHDF